MRQSYHQTNDVQQAELGKYEAKAQSQEAKVLAYFKNSPSMGITIEHVQRDKVLPKKTPKSSLVRSISNLRKAGWIYKTGQTLGKYGRPINTYTITAQGMRA